MVIQYKNPKPWKGSHNGLTYVSNPKVGRHEDINKKNSSVYLWNGREYQIFSLFSLLRRLHFLYPGSRKMWFYVIFRLPLTVILGISLVCICCVLSTCKALFLFLMVRQCIRPCRAYGVAVKTCVFPNQGYEKDKKKSSLDTKYVMIWEN